CGATTIQTQVKQCRITQNKSTCVFERPFLIFDVLNVFFLGSSGLISSNTVMNAVMLALSRPQTNVIPIGSFMPIWAAVEQKSHQPLTLLMDECVAASTPDLQPGSQIYPLVVNHGCLLESKRGSALFLPRYHSSAIVLYLQSFKFGMGEVYIHCNLIVWDPDSFDQRKKACHVKDGSWELLDDPNRSFLCNCCETSCGPRRKRAAALGRF
uniref:Zona pellucida glycoprotein 3f, tandem duplicate 2 n=1 Tax=Cyprinodon variegatus TaxID=28743 RepID=A0A3Q2CI28_CYPVA